MTLASSGLPPSYFRQDPQVVRGVAFDWQVFRRLLTMSRHRLKSVLALTLAVLAGSLIGLVPPLIFRQIIDHDIPSRRTGSVISDGLLALAAYLVGLSLSSLGNYLSARVSTGIIVDIRLALFDKLQRMPHLFFTRARSGMITSRFINDVNNAQQLITVTFGTALGTIVTFSFTIVIMAYLSWQVTLFSLIAVPAFVIPSFFMSRRVQAIVREQLQRFGELTSFIDERLDVNGSLLVKLFSQVDRENAAFAQKANAVRSNYVKLSLHIQGMTLSTALMGIGGLVATYIYGGISVINGTLTLGTMVALSTYILRAATPVLTLSNARSTFLQAQVALERVFEVLDAPDVDDGITNGGHSAPPSGDVVFSHVSFRYPPANESFIPSLEVTQAGALERDPWSINDVSFRVEQGTITALVGPTGAGKSTLCGLLAGLYRPDEGKVSIGGVDLGVLRGSDIRDVVGMVSQDAHFFHDTIAANLRLARPEAEDEELVEACRRARIHDLIASLPGGYETLVGERGHRFSGGEKQRLAVARLLLKDPAVVILDEATAHLDSRTEQLVKEALSVALRGRTALIIAHRLSTVVSAEQILVLVDGHVVERGRHQDLLAAGGTYRDLYTTQFQTDSD